jgi:hypothetical protein
VATIQENNYRSTQIVCDQNYGDETSKNKKIYVGSQVRQEANKSPPEFTQTFPAKKYFIE